MFLVHTFVNLPDPPMPSIFLVGPTPRSNLVKSWRPDAIQLLDSAEFDGCVFVPEWQDGEPLGKIIDEDVATGMLWQHPVEWERDCLEIATVIAAWVPRDLETMPAFTTNVEFGRYVTSGRLLYGRPHGAPKTEYLDWLYHLETNDEPLFSLKSLMETAAKVAVDNHITKPSEDSEASSSLSDRETS